MSLVPRPTWEPIPDPPGQDPAAAQDFQVLAAELMPGVESGVETLGSGLVDLDTARVQGDAAMVSLAGDLAAGSEAATALSADADADTLEADLARAVQVDDALDRAGSSLGNALGV